MRISLYISILILSVTCCLLPVQAQGHYTYNARRGIITTGDSCQMRSFAAFSVAVPNALHYPEALNEYKDSLPDVRIYSMIIPTAVQYYCPEELKQRMRDEAEVIDSMYTHLCGVIPVNIVSVMEHHKEEAIYSRTDHHWAPLGAFYAAEVFAKVAKVPFRDLSSYDKHVVHDFCGTMPKFGGSPRLRNYPEEFIYYVPKDSSYTTTYVSHTRTGVKGAYKLSEPFQGPFFLDYKDGSSGAYCTFMGGDTRTTHVRCEGLGSVDMGSGNAGHRKLMIIKDSFGNALPGYLFYSFSDIYIVDFRYFQKNIISYVEENGITDILFANNMSHACSKGTSRGILNMLHKRR